MSQRNSVTVAVSSGSKCHGGRNMGGQNVGGRNVKAPNFSAILNFCKAGATVPLKVLTLLKLKF